MEKTAILDVAGLTFGYRKNEAVLRDVSFTVEQGRFLCILGPNGSGKTTLFRCLLRSLRPQAGQIRLWGRDLRLYTAKALARLVGYVPQFPESTFAFTVRELVLMGRYAYTGALGLASREDAAVADAMMARTGTTEFAQRCLHELSGGQAQRVMIARALAQEPKLLLLDEPTSHLDMGHQLKIYELLRELAHESGMTVICVSHDVNLAGQFADELLLMDQGIIAGKGACAAILTKEVLEKMYQVEVEFIAGRDQAVPLVWARKKKADC